MLTAARVDAILPRMQSATCQACLATFKRPSSQMGPFCSRRCAGTGKRKSMEARPCLVCGKGWTPTNRAQRVRNKTCSTACAAKMGAAATRGRARPRNPAAWVTLACSECGVTFERRHAWAKAATEHPACSRSCNGKARGRALAAHPKHAGTWTTERRELARQRFAGEANPAWKGGATLKRAKGNYSGVRYVRCPMDLLVMARSDGYVMEHRLIMARMARRPLARFEVVHHRNHRPADNRPANLELWPSNSAHKLAEHGRLVEGAACRWCPGGSAQT